LQEILNGIEELERIYNHDPVILKQIYALFLQKVPDATESLQEMSENLSTDSLERVIILVHLLANNTSVLRQYELAEIAQKTESFARSGNVSGVIEELRTLLPGINALVAEVSRRC